MKKYNIGDRTTVDTNLSNVLNYEGQWLQCLPRLDTLCP